jgi:hypothetical protein
MYKILLTAAWMLAAICASYGTPLEAPDGSRRSADLEPAILSRQDWQAKPPLPGMKPQSVIGVILHHTGVAKNRSISLQAKMQNLQSFSQRPGLVSPNHSKPSWPDVPYHFYVGATGQIAEGRDVNFAGDTNTGYDTSGYIQIAIEGDFEKEKPDSNQLNAVRKLLAWILISHSLPSGSITVHKDHAPTDCPGRNFLIILPKLLSEVSEIRSKSGFEQP